MSDHHIIDQVLARHGHDGTRLMQILRETQEALNWLSPATLTHIADGVGWPRAQVSGTAAFYSFFHTRPRGKYCVLWSDNITDRMLGNAELMDAMCKKLWLEPGRVSEDGLVSVNTTSCTGMCDQGPAILVNYRAIPRMTQAKLGEIVAMIREQRPVSEWPAEWFAVEDNIRRKGLLLDHGLQPGQALKAALERGPEAMLAEVKAGKLRGRGGAGFGTGIKWEACRNASGNGQNPAHYVVCNADEGEPGTFKDRVLLTSHADLVFEGMSIAGPRGRRGKGCSTCAANTATCWRSWSRRWRHGARPACWVPTSWAKGFDFDIEIHLGAGAYICGEESALIESLEGKPGKPRIRPPFPVTRGYLDQPTTVNNVETLALLPDRRAEGRRLVCRARHREVRRQQDPLGQRRLRAAGHLRIRLWRQRAAGIHRLRRHRFPGGAGLRPLRHLRRYRGVRSPHRLRGPRHGRRLHGLRRITRHVRGGAQLRPLLRPRELRLLHALPRRHHAGEAT
jgi:[NiFe] hydrogenase diaphorase moiety large subunit